MKRIFVLIISLLLLSSCLSHVVFGPEDLNKNLVKDPVIRTGVLDNGLRYVIRVNKNPEKKAEFRFGVNVGSLLESEDEQGAAHFIEHMAFNGTRNFRQNELFDFFQKNGMAFGPDLNAYTSHTKTVYRFSLPTDQKEIIDKGFLILKDWANEIVFEKIEVDKERNIILEELRARKSVSKRVRDQIMPLVCGPSYLKRLPIGKESIIKTITHQRLKAVYKQWYQPGRMSVVVVGDIDADEIESKIKSTFSSLKNNENLPELKDFDIPEYKTVQYLNVKDPELTEASIKIYQLIKTNKLLKENDLRQYLTEQLYITILRNRLMDKSLSERSYHRVLCSRGWQTDHDGFFYLEAKVKDNKFRQCFKDIFLEYERLTRYGVLKSELKEAKKNLLKGSVADCVEQDTKKSKNFANKYIIKVLQKSIIFSPISYSSLCTKYLPSIQVGDINNFYNQLDASNRVVISMGNNASSKYLPNKKKIEEIVAEVKSKQLAPYSHQITKSGLLTKDVTKGTIVKKTYYKKINVTILELSNGARVILKPTLFKRNDISFWCYSPGGLSLLKPELLPLKLLADPIVQNSGIGHYSKQELYKKLMSKKIRARVYVDPYEEGIRGNCSPENIELFFQIISHGISQPRFDENAFEEQKIKYAQQIKHMQNTAFWKFQRKIIETTWPDNDYSQPITEESIMQLDSNLCKKSLKDRFQNAEDFTFQFVGNFKMHNILPLVEKYLAGLPAGKAKEQPKDLGLKPLPGKYAFSINENLEDKSNIIIQLNHYYTITERKVSEFSALENILNMKIIEELREKQGLIYSGHVACRFYSVKPSPHSQIIFHFTCAPENVDRVVCGLKAILQDLRETRMSKEKIETIKKILLNQSKKTRSDNDWWSHALRDFVMLNQDLNTLMEHENYIKELTPATLQNHAKKYLEETNILIAVLNPKSAE
ncbi:MAG: insulinase family protein [Desulfobacula sp.]|uniref:M16 family metallopeptidase n=1 Tax=Desulfobacula sp. TaxID=2593537 RepID=UPI0025C3CF10|nr:M16 family metallopeptidase [Desulfobacula sp.]MCD4721154.1 insulinase family protein [Desulfobacula sp.]